MCPASFNGLDFKGQYVAEEDGLYAGDYQFLKRDETHNRCMILYVRHGGAPALGLRPSNGSAVEKVVLTNRAANCVAVCTPPPSGQTVEAYCGVGSFSIEMAGGGLTMVNVDATFGFPQTYPWVPPSDTYCVHQDLLTNPGWVSGC